MEFTIATPSRDLMMACELEHGMPSHQVATTATPPSTTPRKFNVPDGTTAGTGLRLSPAVRVDDGHHGVGGIVKAVRELERQYQDEAATGEYGATAADIQS
jgi:hypothetical protein